MGNRTVKENVGYKLRLYQLRSDLLSLGCLQPVKWMIEDGTWQEDANNHNYLSGRVINEDFIIALDRLKNKLS